MKRIKSKVVQDFIGTINDKTIYNEDLYCNIESLLDTLWDKLKNIDIPKENELINDFIDSISNIYKLSDITLGDIYDAVYTSIYTHEALLSAELDKDGNIVLYNDTLSDTDYDYTVENLRDLCGYDACSIADALNYPEDYFNKKALEDHYDEIMRFLNSKSNINKIYDDFDKFINEIQLPFEWTHLTA